MSDPNLYRSAAPKYAGLDESQALIASFLRRVYGWMFVGLAATAITAWQVASSEAAVKVIFGTPFLFFALLFGELGLVWWISARVGKMAPSTTAALFVVYSVVNGLTLSVVLLAYTGASIETTFLTAAAMFGALALFGTLTGRNLQGMGQFAMMGLFGLLAAMLVGFFWHSDALQFIISIVGVIVFTGLTAWDAQKLKSMALALEGRESGGYAISGALALYLDFVNLFLFLLRFLGRRR
ncbi:MAG TPA: Bax inhibitor-1/YccA family protein [Gemmatimonadales bacterium]|nr:Bax inhibitor-1/YccA family protein [Gemmatimonadales bacterium]